MKPVLELNNIYKNFIAEQRTTEVLRGISFSIKQGEFVGITGPSGAGKSTLLNICAFLDQPSSGELVFDKKNASCLTEQQAADIRKSSIGMVFQKYCLLPYRTVLENVLFRFRYVNIEKNEMYKRSLKAIKEMGLSKLVNQQVRLLSGGEMQRTAIARAVVTYPSLLLADEPTGNLDSKSTENVMSCFLHLNQRYNLTILLVTHNEQLLTYCHRHLVCNDGKVYDVIND